VHRDLHAGNAGVGVRGLAGLIFGIGADDGEIVVGVASAASAASATRVDTLPVAFILQAPPDALPTQPRDRPRPLGTLGDGLTWG